MTRQREAKSNMLIHPCSGTIAHRAFAQRIRPAPVDGGFAMPGYWVWCGAAMPDGQGKYHLFAARWPQEMKFLTVFTTASTAAGSAVRNGR